MKAKGLIRFALILTVTLFSCSGRGQSAVSTNSPSPSVPSAPTPNGATRPANFHSNILEVVKLVRAGLGNDIVLAFVNSSQSLYNLSANDILQLKDLAVSPIVIAAMMNHDSLLRNRQ